MEENKRKELLIEIMEENQKLGLYNNPKQSAVEWLIEQLWAPCRGIPSHIIEQAKQMEKEQIISAWVATENELQRIAAEKYYNETYNK